MKYTITATVAMKMRILYNKFLDNRLPFVLNWVISVEFLPKSTKKIISVKKKAYFCEIKSIKLEINTGNYG